MALIAAFFLARALMDQVAAGVSAEPVCCPVF
jgi:hypothetical protein